jgi:hypothetical protein
LDFTVNNFKAEYLNEGSNIQNIKLEHNIVINVSRTFRYLAPFLILPKNARKKC